jgi:hypothetical protein
MASNISCFAGCNNAVIGQCAGHKGKCGRFYCPAHTDGTLCSGCGGRKRLEAVVKDYWTTAERIYAKKPFLSEYMLIFLGIIAGICAWAGAIGGLVFCAVLAAPFVIFIVVRRKTVEKAIDDTDKIKPGFYEICQMYLDYEAARESEALSIAVRGLLGSIVEGVGVGISDSANIMAKSMMGIPPYATRHDILRAIQNLKK